MAQCVLPHELSGRPNPVDYFIGRKVSGWLDELGLEHVAGEGHTAVFNGGSGWATYWAMTARERAARLLQSGHVTQEMLAQLENRFRDPHCGPA